MIKVFETNLLKPIDKELVKIADEFGYKGISVCVLDPKIEQSIYWSTTNVKFLVGEPDERTKNKGRDSDGWPGVWRITEKLGGGAGCGNHQQRQLTHDHKFSEVSYLKIKGVWYISNGIENITKSINEKFNL
jgi:hypothetical protein